MGADLPDVFKNLLLENNNSEVYQKLGVTTFAEYVSKYFAKLVIEIVAFLVTFLICNHCDKSGCALRLIL